MLDINIVHLDIKIIINRLGTLSFELATFVTVSK